MAAVPEGKEPNVVGEDQVEGWPWMRQRGEQWLNNTSAVGQQQRTIQRNPLGKLLVRGEDDQMMAQHVKGLQPNESPVARGRLKRRAELTAMKSLH